MLNIVIHVGIFCNLNFKFVVGGTIFMNKIVTIENVEMQIREYNGQRVVTFDDIAQVHDCKRENVRRNFTNNKKHFVMGVDYFEITRKELKEKFSLNLKLKGNPNIKVQLFTETGYLMVVKSLSDDLAWEVQRQLVNGYFKTKNSEETLPQVIEQPPVQLIPSYQTSTTPVPRALTWYQRNKRRIEFIITEGHVERKTLYHHILLVISEEYDIDAARDIYADEHNGMYPKYSIDIVSYFPELAEVADKYLDCLERQLKRKLGMIKD